jgi:hypothetical protein
MSARGFAEKLLRDQAEPDEVVPISLEITEDGGVRMLHDDAVNLAELGEIEVTRASNVEFDNAKGCWYVQSAATMAILKDDFVTREEALKWEKKWYSPTGPGWAELTEGK